MVIIHCVIMEVHDFMVIRVLCYFLKKIMFMWGTFELQFNLIIQDQEIWMFVADSIYSVDLDS